MKDEVLDQSVSQIGYGFLIYVYMVCADGQEHINESRELNKIAESSGVNDATKQEAIKILSQSDDGISLNVVIKSIPEESWHECMQYLAYMAYVDGYCDPLERDLLELLANKWRISTLELDKFCADGEALWSKRVEDHETLDFPQHLSLGERLIAGANKMADGQLLRAMKSLPSTSIKQVIAGLEQRILLSGPEYDSAIEKCREIALEDIAFATPALHSTRDELVKLQHVLKGSIEKLEKSNDRDCAAAAKEVISFLKGTDAYFESEIFRKVEAVNASLRKKERAMQYFTISFLGKTKAGKSTLHAVITGEGEDAIGAGKQRTTRLNRVYEWKNIRIIDTPGIGAPGGKTDEEIAQSVIDESDIICFVLNNNNQQETEFAFLEHLKAKAKPLLILLNLQENLGHPRKLERFLENPDKLFSIEDKKGLGGHVDRIKRYAEQHYGNAFFEIIPVQLYAALMSRKAEDKSKQRELLEASRLHHFLDSLKVSLIRDGVIHRSQTLLGCTVAEVEPISSWLTDKISELEESHATIIASRKSGLKKMSGFRTQAKKELKREFGKIFSDLRGSIQDFSEAYWDEKEAALNRRWEEHAEKRKGQLDSALKKVMNSYSNDIQDLLEEIGTELSLLSKLGLADIALEEQSSSTFIKNFMKLGGGLLGIAGSGAFAYAAFVTGAANWWNPVGWGLVAVGLVVGLLSGLFSSKAKKMQKAVSNLTNALQTSVDKQEKEITDSVLKEFQNHMKQVEGEITDYFTVMEGGLCNFMKAMKSGRDKLYEIKQRLNFAYAKRVVDWLQDTTATLTEESIQKTILSVERCVGQEMSITTVNEISCLKDHKEIEAVLQEKLIIKGV